MPAGQLCTFLRFTFLSKYKEGAANGRVTKGKPFYVSHAFTLVPASRLITLRCDAMSSLAMIITIEKIKT